MIGRIIHWVYCLPIGQAALFALVATGAYFWLYRKFSQKRWWPAAVIGLLLCWAAVVLAHTVLSRVEGTAVLSLMPFQTYITVLGGGERELLRSAFMNVLLFYPGALLLRSILPRGTGLLVVLGLFAATVVIEVCQFALQLGYAETDDVLHNTLGAVLGVLACRQYEKHNKTPKG